MRINQVPWRDLMVEFSYKVARENLIKKVTFEWQLKLIFTFVFVYFSFYILNISVIFFFRVPPLFFYFKHFALFVHGISMFLKV